jgi:hypothetical protein
LKSHFYRARGKNFEMALYRMFILQAYQTFQYVVPRGGIFSRPIYKVFIVQAYQTSQYARRHFSWQVAQLFRRKFRR